MPKVGNKKFGYDLKGIGKAKKYAEKTGMPVKVDSGVYGKTNQYPANRAEAKSPVRKKPYNLKRNLKKRGMK
tara:strand:- start:58 stop:273 length:216 start_codon:yes stop_codon:yes gene_type:complete